jgi:hypothetical protein
MGKELSVKVGIWKLVEFLLDDTKTFSLSSIDGVFTYRSKDIAYSTRKSEIEIATKQMMPLMIHLIMYCYPDEYLGSKERLKSNEDEILKKWLRKISSEMLVFVKSNPYKRGRFTPIELKTPFTPANVKTMKENLEKQHGYTNAVLNGLVVSEIQRIFLSEWDMVINRNITIGATSVPDNELLGVLRSTKNEVFKSVYLSGFKINRANVFKIKSN